MQREGGTVRDVKAEVNLHVLWLILKQVLDKEVWFYFMYNMLIIFAISVLVISKIRPNIKALVLFL